MRDFGPGWEVSRSDLHGMMHLSKEKTSLDNIPSPPLCRGHQSYSDNSNSINVQTSQKSKFTQGSPQGPPSTRSKTTLVSSPNFHTTIAPDTGISPFLPPPTATVTLLKRPLKDMDQGINLNAHMDGPPTMLDKKNPTGKKEQKTSGRSSQFESDESDTLVDPNLLTRSRAMEFVPLQVGMVGEQKKYYGTSTSCRGRNKLEPSTHVENLGQNKRLVNDSDPRAVTDRRLLLIIRLIQIFPDYALRVSELGQPQGYRIKTPPILDNIHVFVDMSNILFGLHESIQDKRDGPSNAKANDLDISFANFALIIERGRLAAKRVLAGSDHLPATKDAESLGYEVNILNRVRKGRYRVKPEMASTSGQRWVEQGVDEILHLKMLESILDSEEPTTMVLASGDAARAEYSDGFLAMVKRALQRGWNVELVSFRKALGSAYRNKEFRAMWGPRFQILLLDEFVHSLYEGYFPA
ncbi:hypothetical protein N7540_006795 [Penicillium herquei]|nr:hypothetical protein N7540_006795 [Penicillium herquei]